MKEKIAIVSDHAGFALKAILKDEIEKLGYLAVDLGTKSEASVDYPDFGYKLAKYITKGEAEFGVAICGSGIGISIAANRNPYIRAALCHSIETARLARQHNNANVLAIGARIVDTNTAKAMLDTFLKTLFEGGRHIIRVEKLGNKQGE